MAAWSKEALELQPLSYQRPSLLKRLLPKREAPETRYDKNRFMVMAVGSCGFQDCPWGCHEDKFGYPTYSGTHTYIFEKDSSGKPPINAEEVGDEGANTYLSKKAFLVVTGLTPHLIASHGFFEGNTPYRTNPERLLEFINSGKKK